MTDDRKRSFACWWSSWYTRGLPTEVRDRRIAEIACDVHEHTCAASSEPARAPRRAITWRAVRGIPADVIWRRQEKQAMQNAHPDSSGSRLRNVWAVGTQAWFAPLAVLVGLFDLLAALAVLQEEDGKMPGQVIGPIVMTALALSLFTGLWLRWRASRQIEARGPAPASVREPASGKRIALLAAVLVLMFLLLTVGVSTGTAPVFFIAMVLIGATALVLGGRAALRAIRSSNIADKAGLADALVIVGTLPALALFWMVIPALVALAVIAGVLGTSPRLRTA